MTTLHGLSLALFAWTLMGLVRRSTALLATLLFFVEAIALVEYPVLWNPTLVPIVSVLFFASLMGLLRRGRLIDALLAGVCLSLVVDVHLVHFVYVPVYLLAVGTACRRPWWAVLLGSAACLGLLWLVSRGALMHNLAQLHAAGLLLPVAWALPVPFLVGLAWRDAYDVLEAPVLQFLLLAFVCLVLMLGPVVAQQIAIGHAVVPRYFLPAIPLATLLLAHLSRQLPGSWMLRRVSFVLVWGYTLFLALAVVRWIGPSKTYWSAAEVEALAGALHRKGYSYETLVRHLRGPEHQLLLKCLAVFAPQRPAAARTLRRTEALYVTRLHWSALPRHWGPERELALLGGPSVVQLRRLETWVDVDCKKPCAYASVRPVSHFRRATVSFLDRPVRELRYSVVIRGSDPARTIRVLGRHSPWRIAGVSGVRWSGKLPARQVVLLRSAQKTGTITFRVRPEHPPSGVVPAFVEERGRSSDSRIPRDNVRKDSRIRTPSRYSPTGP